MKASERLRELSAKTDDPLWASEVVDGWLIDLAHALPLIADVVEAAEMHIDLDEFPEDGPKIDALRDALQGEVGSPSGSETPTAPEEELVTDENLAARVQEAQRLLKAGDEAALIAYLLKRPVEDVRRVLPLRDALEADDV